MLSEASKKEKIANAVLGAAMAATAAQSPKDIVRMGHIESPGVALMQMFSQKRKEAERNLDHGRVSHGARNIKDTSERSRKKKKIEESKSDHTKKDAESKLPSGYKLGRERQGKGDHVFFDVKDSEGRSIETPKPVGGAKKAKSKYSSSLKATATNAGNFIKKVHKEIDDVQSGNDTPDTESRMKAAYKKHIQSLPAKTKYKKADSIIRRMKTFEQFCAEAYVPLRTSDEMHDDEGFPTRTLKWSKKMTDARMRVGREKAKGRYGATPNISRGVAASRKLEKMKAIDAEPESVRRKRGEARQRANNMLGANRRRLQTAMDREHLEKSLKKEDFMMEMRKEDKVKGEKKTPLFVTSTSGRVVKNPETGRLEVKKATRTSLSPRASIGRIKQAMKSPLNKYGEPETYGAARHPHGGGGSGAKAPGRKRGVGKLEQQKIDKEKRDKGERPFEAGPSPAKKVELKRSRRERSMGGGSR